jgi:endonuclease/exonuclease/phosphatase family metal-dependent hydrolase
MPAVEGEFRVVSYNIHRCIGRDRRQDPKRVAAVIGELNADIIGLQEVESRFGASEDARQLDYIARMAKYERVAGVTITRPDSHYGNGLLTRLPIQTIRRHDLGVARREPRGVLDVTVDSAGHELRVLVTHLGLTWRERRRQAQLIATLAGDRPERPMVLLADFNEWLPWGFALHRMNRCFKPTPAPRTFPAHRPMFRLDRAWVRPREALREMWAHDTSLAREASDHLPVVAQLDLKQDMRNR